MTRQLTILVVDDSDMNRRLMGKFIHHLGHTAATAPDGLEAVNYCRKTIPDVILMDVMMPVMDGFQATEEIRKLLGDRWVPIIFLTAMIEHESMLKGLEVGGDDYMTKPVDLTVLAAKIKVLLRIADMRQRIESDAIMLEQYFETNEEEQSLALHVLERFTAQESALAPNVQKWILPALNFSGDVISIAQSPTGVDYILLADSTGHGLAAAISCLPAVDTFFEKTHRGFSISTIARDINKKLHTIMPVGRFLAAAIIAVDYRERTIAIWNGGIPCAFYLGADGQIEKQFISSNPPLGILPDDEFEATLDVHRWRQDGELIVCSDGVTEAYGNAHVAFGAEGVAQAARSAQGQHTSTRIADALLEHLGGLDNHDDVSLVVVSCQAAQASQADAPSTAGVIIPVALPNWEVKLTFAAYQLREQDCSQILIGWLNQLNFTQAQLGDVLLIVTELFNNALDHGVLGLPGSLKNADDGFAEFLTQRAERLDALQSGQIEVGMSRIQAGEQATLQLWLRDSGTGFDYSQLNLDPNSSPGLAPQGLAMVASLCRSLRFEGAGNVVVAEYLL